MIPGEAESLAHAFLDCMLLAAIGFNRLSRLESGKLGRRSVLVSGANQEGFPASCPLEPSINIGRKLRPDKVPQMLNAVDIGERAGDQNTGFAVYYRHALNRHLHETKEPGDYRKPIGSCTPKAARSVGR